MAPRLVLTHLMEQLPDETRTRLASETRVRVEIPDDGDVLELGARRRAPTGGEARA